MVHGKTPWREHGNVTKYYVVLLGNTGTASTASVRTLARRRLPAGAFGGPSGRRRGTPGPDTARRAGAHWGAR